VRCFLALSSLNGSERTSVLTSPSTEPVSKPKLNACCNTYMSGTDRCDQLLVYYALNHKTIKFAVFAILLTLPLPQQGRQSVVKAGVSKPILHLLEFFLHVLLYSLIPSSTPFPNSLPSLPSRSRPMQLLSIPVLLPLPFNLNMASPRGKF